MCYHLYYDDNTDVLHFVFLCHKNPERIHSLWQNMNIVGGQFKPKPFGYYNFHVFLCRIFRQPQGHLLLIGVSGAGKTTLSRFVAWMNGLSVYQIKVGAVSPGSFIILMRLKFLC